MSLEAPRYFTIERYLSEKWTKIFDRIGWTAVLYENRDGLSALARGVLPVLDTQSLEAFSVPSVGADIQQWYSEVIASDTVL